MSVEETGSTKSEDLNMEGSWFYRIWKSKKPGSSRFERGRKMALKVINIIGNGLYKICTSKKQGSPRIKQLRKNMALSDLNNEEKTASTRSANRGKMALQEFNMDETWLFKLLNKEENLIYMIWTSMKKWLYKIWTSKEYGAATFEHRTKLALQDLNIEENWLYKIWTSKNISFRRLEHRRNMASNM